MTEKEQKDLIDRVESLEENIKKKPYSYELRLVWFYLLLFMAVVGLGNKKQNKTDEDLYSKNEELRKIICDIHKDTNTPAPKYDFKANKFVTSGYKYDPNLVKKLKELCKSNTH